MRFDGFNFEEIIISLSSVFRMKRTDFEAEFVKYYIEQKDLLDNGFNIVSFDVSVFVEQLQVAGYSIAIDDVKFDSVVMYHISSTIDDGAWIRKNGLMNFDRCIFSDSVIKSYLSEKQVSFIKDEDRLYLKNQSDIIEISKLDYPCGCVERARNLLYNRFFHDNCVNGFLFYEYAINCNEYNHIRNIPEFLINLRTFMPSLDIDWEVKSTPIIVKSIVDISWLNMFGTEKIVSDLEKSKEIIEIAFKYISESFRNFGNKKNRSIPNFKLFLEEDKNIPSDNIIEIIKYL